MKDFKSQVHTLRHALEHEEKNSGKLFIKEFPPSTITPKQLSAFVKRFADSGIEIDAIVIDYLGLLHSTEGSNSYERIKYICEQVRAMSYVFKCPIISAVQLQRCLDINSIIFTENGNKKIGDVVVGDRIMGKNGLVDVCHVYPRETKKVFRIKTKSGKEIICSKEHIFPTKGGINSIEDGLTVGDILFSASQNEK
jgi:hypothetical protein